MNITSINNPFIKELCKLKNKKNRDEQKKFLIEGYHLVDEALKANALETVLIVSEDDYLEGVKNIVVTEAIIEKIATTKTPQKIIGVCKYLENKQITGSRFIILDNLQDPGNIGTIIRSSLGFNIDMVILSDDCVDVYNEKVIRSTQGAIFKVPFIKGEISSIIDQLKKKNVFIYGTSLINGENLSEITVEDKFAIILGNEGQGIKKEILSITDKNIFINIAPQLESLNVGVAAGILMYYFNNQNN